MYSSKNNTHLRVGAVLAAIYVILGAFGAHGLESKLIAKDLATYQTGLRYLILHAIALIITNYTLSGWGLSGKWSSLLFYIGILLFSFSLMIHATRSLLGIEVNVFALIAPIGGLSFVAGWIVYLFKIPRI